MDIEFGVGTPDLFSLKDTDIILIGYKNGDKIFFNDISFAKLREILVANVDVGKLNSDFSTHITDENPHNSIPLDQKGVSGGVAETDSNNKVASKHMPDSLVGALVYKGTFDASTGSYPSDSDLATGWYYVADVAGTINGVTYDVGDWAVYNGTDWDKVDSSDKVSSVNSKTGAVVLNTDDISEGSNNKYNVQPDWSQTDNSQPDYIKNKPDTSIMHEQNKDQFLDQGGSNEISAAQAKSAYTHSQAPHAPADAEKNIQPDWNQTDSLLDSYIKNKPDLSTLHSHSNKNILDSIIAAGSGSIITDTERTKLSGIEDGAEVNVQPDWNQTNTGEDDYIKNKPDVLITSDKGVANGVAELDGNGIVPVSQIPDIVKESKVVADIATRDGLSGYEGLRVHVIDATGDSTVDSGGAGYIYYDSSWIKTYEEEGLDAVVNWADIQNKPTSSVSNIDDAVSKRHSQGTDQYLDKGGTNEVTAAQTKTAYDHSQATHAPTDAEANVQPDWSQTDSQLDDYIKNKPTLFSGNYSDLSGKPTKLTEIDTNIFGRVAWSSTDIDWSDERVRDKTLSANETWTFSNLKAGKTISVYVTEDYSITLPSSVTTINGTYDGTKNNLIIFHCIDDTDGAEKIVCQIFNL